MMKPGMTAKKWLLAVHLLFSAILLGVSVTFLILSLTAAAAESEEVLKACYSGMLILARTSIRASTIGTVVTGVLLSVWTHWGLFRYYWIIAKELLTLLSIGLGIAGMYGWSLKAAGMMSALGMQALHDPQFAANRQWLMTGIALQLVSLAAMFLLSVFKPWGKRKIKGE